MDLREIKKLVTLMNENGLSRLEVEEEGRRYLLEKGHPASCDGSAQGGFGITALPQLSSPAAAGLPPVAKAELPAIEDTVTFNSPMVGTFYRAASPEGEPLVVVGDRVTPDSVICLIEAMKVFNEIKAEMTGTIIEILAENQEAVEYNQPLYLIKPD